MFLLQPLLLQMIFVTHHMLYLILGLMVEGGQWHRYRLLAMVQTLLADLVFQYVCPRSICTLSSLCVVPFYQSFVAFEL